MIKRVFLIVADSFGIGELPDAADYGDEGSNTLGAIYNSNAFNAPFLRKMGLFNIDNIKCGTPFENPIASYARMTEQSKGKDTTIGHWEIAGIISDKPLPTYPNGFPIELIREFEKRTGTRTICNKPYSGTTVIMDYGREHTETGKLIVYTSADSVFQIAAHEDIVPVDRLYSYCQIARDLLTGENSVGRVIARPFEGTYPNFKRTTRRHDYSLNPPQKTMLDILSENNFATISVGKIYDIFAGKGLSESHPIKNNAEGMQITTDLLSKDFEGICFVNLVDFDMLYGHRNDVDGYANAISEFDKKLELFTSMLKEDDVLIVTADHGCDPATPSTDHSREYVPLLIYGNKINAGINLGILETFSDVSATILDMFNLPRDTSGKSHFKEIYRG
jgi:phosphopentomutase